jgi:site-specific recombinase XerD
MRNGGANLKAVSNLLGHAHTSTTTDIYWHVIDADQRRQQHQQHNPLRAVLQEAP